MKLRSRLFQDWKHKALGAGLIAVLGMAVWALPLMQGLARFSFDFPFALRPETAPEEVVIIYMDDKSRAQLRQPVQDPWDRALHVQLLSQLTRQNAKVVAFDVLFDEPWRDKSVDEQFAVAMKSHGKVVLGASCQYTATEDGTILGTLRQATESLNSASAWGVAELPIDPDGVIRRHHFDDQYPGLARQAATSAGLSRSNNSADQWINFYGPAGAIRHVSYFDALAQTNLPPNLFSNRVVFVGMAPIITYQGSRSADEYPTPYTRWGGGDSPGVEIQATATLNLIRSDWLKRWSQPAECCVIVLFSAGLVFLTPLVRLRTAFLVTVILVVVLCAVAILCQANFHLWSNWAVVPFIQLPAGVVWMAWMALRQRGESSVAANTATAMSDFTTAGIPIIPEHEMLKMFGEGSYGQVWLARTTLGTYRAVKVVFRKNFQSDGPYEREFRGMKSFEPISRSHEGFVDILQIGRRDAGGYFYYIMELADDQNPDPVVNPDIYTARTLSSELKRVGQIPCAECIRIGMVLAGALQQLHAAGLVHRDIKPSNIIFVNGSPKLADIGLVAERDAARSYVGTEGFIPPEGPGQPQADIYSLGKVLYEMAMGRDRKYYPELPTTLAESPDREQLIALNEIIIKACHDNPARRFATAEKMQTELRKLANRLKKNTPPQ